MMNSFVLLLCVFISGVLQVSAADTPSPAPTSFIKPHSPEISPAKPPVSTHPISPVNAPITPPPAKTPAISPSADSAVPPRAMTKAKSPVSAPTISPVFSSPPELAATPEISGNIPSGAEAPEIFPSGRVPAIPAPATLAPGTAQGPASDDRSGSNSIHKIWTILIGFLIIGVNLVF